VGRGDGKQDTYVGVGGVRTRRGRSKVPEVIIVSRFSPDCEAERTSERERERESTRHGRRCRSHPLLLRPSSPLLFPEPHSWQIGRHGLVALSFGSFPLSLFPSLG
jgi:hypothetical protein